MEMAISLNDDVIWVQPNMAKINAMDYGKGNEWDDHSLKEMNETDYGLKEVRWNNLFTLVMIKFNTQRKLNLLF